MRILLPVWDLGFFLLLQIGSLERVNPAAILPCDGRLWIGISHFNGNVARNIETKRLLETNTRGEIRSVKPEVARSQWIANRPAELGFEDVPSGEGLNGDVLFALVGVHRRFAAYRGIEFLHVGSGSFDECAIGFANPGI